MAKIVAADKPQLTLQMTAMETSTPAHCDQWNTRHQQLLNNDKYLSEQIKETIKNTGEKMEKSAIIDDLDTALAVTEDRVPVGCKAIQELNSNLSERINSGLSDIDVRYNSETGAPEWSPRGADTFHPFSSGKAKAELLWTNSNSSTGFPAQTVRFKENTYNHYIIFFYGRHNIHANPCTAFIESNYTAPGGYFGVKGTGCYYVAGQVSVSRNITATTNASITFSQGYPSNEYIVPYAVYGANIEL